LEEQQQKPGNRQANTNTLTDKNRNWNRNSTRNKTKTNKIKNLPKTLDVYVIRQAQKNIQWQRRRLKCKQKYVSRKGSPTDTLYLIFIFKSYQFLYDTMKSYIIWVQLSNNLYLIW